MFIKDLRRDFYDLVSREHVLIIANVDVDAVCALKILKFLFYCDHVSYTLVPVANVTDLCRAISEHTSQVKNVILINCGATVNLIEDISLPAETIFYVLDSRRPFDLAGVYDSETVKFLIDVEEEKELGIPIHEDIYQNEEDEEDEDQDEDNTRGNDSGDDLFASPRKKKRRPSVDDRKWEENRNQILIDYHEYSFYSNSSAVILFDLAWKLSKDNTDLLWWACIGLTSQFLENKINLSKYVLQSTDLHQHLVRLNRTAQENDRLKLVFEKDLLLSLYRRWSLFESLRHTVGTACYFKSWTFNGECKLLTFLADLGLPLTQCRQRYSAMDANLRKEVHKAVEEKLEKYGLSDLIYVSFSAQYSFAHKISAGDAAEAVATSLNFGSGKDLESNYLTALDCLSKPRCTLLYESIGQCKIYLKTLWTEVKSLLNNGQVVPHSTYLLAQLAVGTPGICYFNKPYGLFMLGQCLLRAFCAQRNGQKHKNKPMIIMAPKGGEEGNEWFLVVGIPPKYTLTDGDKPVNLLGSAFERVRERVRCRTRHEFFDNFVILLKTEDKDRFCNTISGLLEVT